MFRILHIPTAWKSAATYRSEQRAGNILCRIQCELEHDRSWVWLLRDKDYGTYSVYTSNDPLRNETSNTRLVNNVNEFMIVEEDGV